MWRGFRVKIPLFFLDKDSSVEEQIDFAELEQRDGEEDSSQSIDLEIR